MSLPAVAAHAGTLPTPLSRRIDAVVRQALDQRRLVGAVVLVARGGEQVHGHAYGWADRERRLPMAVDTVFRLASASKPIVSVAALVLVAQGRLALDEGVDRWLPDFRPRLADGRPARITARQLLSHTAGLGYRFFEADAQGPYARAGVSDGMDGSGISLAENLRRIASVPLLYAPGFGFGLGFSVLRDPALAASPESAGTWRWGGAYGHSWFVDRAQGLSVVAFTNTLYEGMSGRFVNDLRDAVYGIPGEAP